MTFLSKRQVLRRGGKGNEHNTQQEDKGMNLYLALSLFSLIVLVYWVITELFTMLFRFTGLPDERARFQVISLLTGCGYTTK